MSNDDLLIEILLLLPAISLFLCKSVSKQWLSVITCPTFTLRRSQKPNIDPPSGLFVWGPKRKSKRIMFAYDFISFDIRIPSKISTAFRWNNILQSCNGLLLCDINPDKLCVYNPCLKLFKMLPQPHISKNDDFDGIRLVFDPTKSTHYKVVHAGLKTDYNDGGSYIQIETYSSKTGSWSVCDKRFPFDKFSGFKEGIYSNGAIHWITFGMYLYGKLDILVYPPVLTTTQLPTTLDWKCFCDCKLFESRGCLLLACRDGDSHQLNILEIRDRYSECSLKYLVNLDDIMMPIPKTWSTHTSVWCIILGEREEDSFMVIKSYKKVLQYRIVLKTVHTHSELELTSPHLIFPFIASFARV